MKTHIVLGLGYGDEGKGLTTDLICSKSKLPVVVRFSGGQQAGHTVMINGLKHVHSSFGSGTLRGIPSYFSEHTCIYLNSIYIEANVLYKLGIAPILTVHPLAKLTTPYDVAWNRLIHNRNKHGSVGIGIGATMSRHLATGYKLFVIDLTNQKVLQNKLDNIKKYYMSKLIPYEIEEFNTYCYDAEKLFYELIYKWRQFFDIQDYSILARATDIIFEGSQGIMLDMDHGIFPNVTYSHTTSRNAIEIAKNFSTNTPDIYYVTRCYQTRHGNGWMSNELTPIDLINNEEETNTPNPWQGMMRIGEIDYKLLNYALNIDKLYSKGMNRHLMVTCLDQRPDFKILPEFVREFDYLLESRSPKTENSYESMQAA